MSAEETPKGVAPEAPEPQWEKRPFRINEQMKQVIGLGVKTTELEIATLKRKLEKLQYGG